MRSAALIRKAEALGVEVTHPERMQETMSFDRLLDDASCSSISKV